MAILPNTFTCVEAQYLISEEEAQRSLTAYWCANTRIRESSQIDHFVSVNCEHLRVCYTLWGLYAHDLKLDDLFKRFESQGKGMEAIVSGIQYADDAIASLTEGQVRVLDPFIQMHIAKPYYDDNYCLALSVAISWARMLKRMALKDAPWLSEQAIEKFVKATKYNRLYSNVATSDYLPAHLCEYLSDYVRREILPMISEEMRKVFPERLEDDFDFTTHSSGAVQDACTNAFCKWLRCTQPSYPGEPKVLPRRHGDFTAANPCDTFTPWWFVGKEPSVEISQHEGRVMTSIAYHAAIPAYVVSPITVPKQLSADRVICVEKARYLCMQKSYADQINDFRLNGPYAQVFCYKDQDRARELVGTEGYATVDQTSASDMIRRSFLWHAYPYKEQLRRLLDVMPTHMKVGGRVMPMVCFGTMGSPLTFTMLDGVTAALIFTSMRLANIWEGYGDVVERPDSENDVRVVGDDGQMPAWAAPYFCTLLELLSMKPNFSKSYWGDNEFFRESCGCDVITLQDENIEIPRVYVSRGSIYSKQTCYDSTYDSWDRERKSPLASLLSLANVLADNGGNCSVNFILDVLTEWTGQKILCSPVEQNGCVYFTNPRYWGFADKCSERGKIRYSQFTNLRDGESFLATTMHTSIKYSNPKSTCLCTQLPYEILVALYDRYRLDKWLESGPYYDDPLMELLHVSSRRPIAEFYHAKPQVSITRTSVLI